MRSLRIGPPTVAPNVFRINWPGTFGSPDCSWLCLLNQSLASPTLFRLYSYTEPWKTFVPPFVINETCAPDERP